MNVFLKAPVERNLHLGRMFVTNVKTGQPNYKSRDILKNYLKAAVRNLWKNKAFSLINIIGLAALPFA
jgi:hypothetical protein